MAAYNIKDIKDKKKLINLANYGTAERRLMRPKVLIGAGKEKPFIEGDILDANATLNLIEDTYDKGRIFRSFSKEGKKIDKEIKELLEKTDENYEQLSSAIADNKEDADQKIDQLSSKVDNIESNIPNLRRVVDIQLQSVLDGTKTYLVTKQGDVQEQIQISDGEKGEQGEKGDPFTYEDFTPEQIEGLKVKGDRGISISSLEQTQTAYTSGGVNEFTVTLDDGTVSRWYVRNGQKGDATKIWVNANTVHSGYYDSDDHEIKLLNADGGIMSIIDATAFIKDGMISDAYVENGYIVIVFNTDAGQTPIMIPVTDIFDADDYYTKLDTDARIAEDVLVETLRAEAAELQLTDDLAQEVSDRLSSDTTLNTKIETETTRATTAESGLSTYIRQLGSALYSEQQNRAAADNLLESKIGAETSRATTAEGLLDQKITSNNAAILAEAARAAAAESALSDAIDAEESTRIQEIDDLQDLLDAYIQSNDAAVQAEVSRATAAEQTNATAISTESSRAQSAELALLGAINTEASTRAATITAEETRATTAEQSLQDNIDAEEQRAIAAELDLQDAIDAVEQGAGQDTAAVEQALNDEISRATLAEQLISSNLSAEITRATNADNANSTAISNEVSRATAAEQQNASDIDAIEALIPSLATSSNQLADKAFVNSSIATSTATFVGTFNDITDLYAVTTADANDYGYVITTDSAGNTKYNRYKYDGSQWDFEYALNNSSFTAEEWAAIQSGMTQALRIKLENLPSTAVTSVGVSVPTGLTVTGSPITSSGTIAINFTSGYSIPTTSSLTNWDTAYGWGNHANANYVKSVKVGIDAYNPSSGIVSLPAYPTTLPASDVYSWAKASTKPSYTLDEVSDGSTRKLANYLPLSGGTVTGNLIIGGSDIPEGAADLNLYASVHSIKFYRNGFLISYQMDNADDGGFFRVRGTTENNTVCEIGTWDDFGGGETIQFNYYPTTSTINPTYSVSVPKATGTLALTSQLPTAVSQLTNDAGYATETWVENNYLYSFGSVDAHANTNDGYYVGMTKESGITPDWWHILSMAWGTSYYVGNNTWLSQLALPTQNIRGVYYRKGIGESTKTQWYRLCDADGDGASGTWGISITGNASTATSLQTARTIWGQSFDGTGNITGRMTIEDVLNSPNWISDSGQLRIFNSTNVNYRLGLGVTTSGAIIQGGLTGAGAIPLCLNPSGGNVGIGTTNPAYKFDLADSTNNWTIHSYNSYSSYKSSCGLCHGVGYGMYVGVSSTSSSKYIMNLVKGMTEDTSGGSSAFYVRADGNVGIGTTSPSYKLHVAGDAAATTIYENGTALSSKYAPISHTHSYLPTSGGTVSGNLTVSGTLTCSNISGAVKATSFIADHITTNSAASATLSKSNPVVLNYKQDAVLTLPSDAEVGQVIDIYTFYHCYIKAPSGFWMTSMNDLTSHTQSNYYVSEGRCMRWMYLGTTIYGGSRKLWACIYHNMG